MSNARAAELEKRNRKLLAILGQRELTQDEKDEWEELVRQMNELQGETLGSAE
ncbi:MAG TPA: hypothetical protein VM598_08455 [Bdellovibrionota bacterium]|nr:hypothetical protein [Bdellovibrionota bacterium]